MQRFFFDFVLFISVFVFPWWLSVAITFFGLFVYKNFYEFILAFAILYSIYTVPANTILTSKLWFPVIVSIIFISAQYLRRYIVLYKNEI